MVFLKPLIRYADFKGRSGRAEYWGFFLFQSCIGGLLVTLTILSTAKGETGAGALIGGLLTIGTVLAFIIPNWAVTVRRLHDTNRSALWLLLQAPSVLAPISFGGAILGILGERGVSSAVAAQTFVTLAGGGLLLLLIGGVCSLILMTLMWLPGTDGENRFGPDPRSPEARLHLGAGNAAELDSDRFDAIFAEARRERELTVQPDSSWDQTMPTPGFGRRGLSG